MAGVPGQRGGAVPQGLDRHRAARHRERLTTPLVRDRATGELRRGRLGRGARPRRRPAARRCGRRTARTRSAVFGGGGLTNEKAYQLGKFARVALGTSQIDYNGRWCMSSAASAGQPGLRHRPRAAVPAGRRRADRRARAGRLQPRRDDAARRAAPRPAARERRHTSWSIDPRRTPTADRADAAPPAGAGHRPGARPRACCTCSTPAGAVDEEYVAARTTGFDDVRRVGRRRGGPSGSSGSPACRPPSCGRWPTLLAGADRGDGADRPRRRAARPGHRHRARPGSTSRSRSGMPGRPYAGYGCLTGQGNGQGGREHGQKADQLPGYRMIDDPAAREHVAAGVGRRRRTSLPGKGRSAYELLDALGTDGGPRALLVFGSNIVGLRAQRHPRHRRGSAALDLLVVADLVMSRDRGARRRRAAGHPVGRGDRHHDQPRGPGDPAPAGRRRRPRACAPTSR